MDIALESLQTLEMRLEQLGTSCKTCHKDDASHEHIIGQDASSVINELRQGITAGDQKVTGRSLGTFAVQTCARCHSIHRSAADMRNLLME